MNMINRLSLTDKYKIYTQQQYFVHILKVGRILTTYSILIHKATLNKFQSSEIKNHEEN